MCSQINCIEYIYQQNRVVAAVCTDLSAAFNIFDQVILLAKLKYYGLTGLKFRLMTSYLKNMQQYRNINCKKSEVN